MFFFYLIVFINFLGYILTFIEISVPNKKPCFFSPKVLEATLSQTYLF